MLDGVASRGASVPDAELVKNRAQMRVDGSAAEKERLGDLVVGHSPRHQPQDLDLSRRQVLEAGRYRRIRFRQIDAWRRRAVVPRGQKWHPLYRRSDTSSHSVAVARRRCIGRNTYCAGANSSVR